MKKNQTELLKMKTIIIALKNSLFNVRLDKSEERISEPTQRQDFKNYLGREANRKNTEKR